MEMITKLKQINLKEFLTTQGLKFTGNKALCPFHNDRVPSLEVSQRDGIWLWFCFACQTGGTIIDFVMKRDGVDEKEAIKKLAQQFGLDNEIKAKPKIIAEYEYHDAAGNLLYKILRFEPKAFKADRKVAPADQVLFRLPQVIKASEVWLLEGEKDVLTAEKCGLIATTAPFGKGNWKPQFSEALAGKVVHFCPDADVPEHEVIARAQEIKKKARAVKIIRLPGLDPSRGLKDLTDWVENYDSKSYEELGAWLRRIAAETPEFREPKTPLGIKNSFLEAYVDSVSQVTDAPPIFILFSGLGLLSGVANKFYFYYPRKTPLNLYILLLAPSTFYRKSVTIDIATDYLTEVNPNLILPESFTSEALLEILTKQNRGLLTWRELIQVKEFQFGSEYNRGLPSLLTDLFDFKPKIRRYTKGEGELVVESPIISILAAGISTWLVENLKKVDFQGGIWTRFLFVPIEESERSFQLPKQFSLDPFIIEKLRALDEKEACSMDLSPILPLLQAWGEKHQQESLNLSDELLKATFQRLEVALIKIACLLQLGEDGLTTVSPEAFREAEKIIGWLKERLPVFFEEEIAFGEFDREKAKILRIIRQKKEIERSALLRRTRLKIKIFDEITKQLLNEGFIHWEYRQKPEARRKVQVFIINKDQ
jgi:hypothetical protein